MNIKKPLLIAGVITSVGAAGLGGTALVSADASSSNGNSLAAKIAQKFNLKTSDVQAVIDQNRADKQADRQAHMQKELDQLVTDGKLTADQREKILAKQKELEAQRQSDQASMKNMTPEQRKAAMDAKRADLEKWAADNNIPTKYLRFVMGGGHGGHGPRGMRTAPVPTTDQN